MSQHCKDLLLWMLEAEPEERPSAKQCLGHAWFQCDKQILQDLLQYNQDMCSSRRNSSDGVSKRSHRSLNNS